MSTLQNMCSTDPQAELRRRFVAAWKAHEAQRARLLARGCPEYDLARHLHFDFGQFDGLTCGAKGKRTGKPCPLTSIYGNGRCKFHGGMSTGPKSAEGKARCSLNGAGMGRATRVAGNPTG